LHGAGSGGFRKPEKDSPMSSDTRSLVREEKGTHKESLALSDEHVVIRVSSVSKCYHLYDKPQDRLRQSIYPRLQRILGREPKAYAREFWALKDISFEVKKGESFGIIGRNGSGKSTLLQLITGTLSPTTGTVCTHGRIAALLELGSGFNPDFTGRENVYLNGLLLGMSREQVEGSFDDIAAFADIGEYIDQPVKTYSSGMLVRLAFAVQVQIQPDILIIDEALAVGDALFQKRCYEKIERLVSTGVTFLFVSHDQEAVRTLTHRSMLLHQGKTVACGLSADVMLAYRSLLHDAESAYFTSISKRIQEEKNKRLTGPSDGNPSESVDGLIGRSATMSFGDGGIKILNVQTFDGQGKAASVFYPREMLSVKIDCFSTIETDRINVAVRIRNKEGLKVYSWGTLNQDMQVLAGLRDGPVFWRRQIHVGDRFAVWLECECCLGANLYEIQAAISYEETPDYFGQRMLHWIDEAAFFQVAMRQSDYFFGGIADLRMTARW
jgi:lipopolysaccharide transport system ATP-binding protein